jgi:hypothetical protein
MNPNSGSCRYHSILRFLNAFLWCLLPVYARSQDSNVTGVRYTYDESDRVVAISYYGSSGLRESATKNNSHVERVEIVYGTTLTAEDVSFLSSLESVEELSMGQDLSDEFVKVEGSLASLANLKRLEYLFLCKRNIRDDDIAFVAQLPKITYLELIGGPNPGYEKGPSITDACAESIGRAKTLRGLRISGGTLTDQFVSIISRDLKDLERLDLGSAVLTDRSLKVLSKTCKNLRVLNLHSNLLTNDGVRKLADAENLETLTIRSTSLTRDCERSISGLISLRHLEFTVPTMTDDAVKVISTLPSLETLALRETRLTNEQFAMFANHPTLNSAFLNGGDLSETNVLETIATIPKLDYLHVLENEPVQITVNRFLASRKSVSRDNKTEDGG